MLKIVELQYLQDNNCYRCQDPLIFLDVKKDSYLCAGCGLILTSLDVSIPKDISKSLREELVRRGLIKTAQEVH